MSRETAENQRERFLSVEKAESRRFEVVKVDFNFEAVLKVLRANVVSCSRLWSCAYEVTF